MAYTMKPEQQKPELRQHSLVEYALQYAQNGWPVFPLHNKKPFEFITPGVKSHGYKDATTNEDAIRAMWFYHPGATIGLATGERSGVIVLDIDPPEGYYSLQKLQADYASLPDTRRSRTGNKGLHFFFQYPTDGVPLRNAVGLAGLEGVDFRGIGGYVVLPPSKLYGNLKYVWGNPETPIAPLPDWLRDMLLESQRQRELIPQGVRFARSSGEKWLIEAVAKAREGNRNDVGFWLACQLRDDRIPFETARSITLTYANLVPEGSEPYTSKEAIYSVTQAYKRPPREPARRVQP
jgi:hypothetical protein